MSQVRPFLLERQESVLKIKQTLEKQSFFNFETPMKYLISLSSVFILTSLVMFSSCVYEEGTLQNEPTTAPMTIENPFSGRPIIFYNVENLFDTKDDPRTDDDEFTPFGDKEWDETRYREKLARIETVISYLDKLPALIGLVEIENRTVLEDLCNTGKLSSIDYGIAQFDSPDRRGIDCALLYDKAVFQVTESTKYPVRLEDNPNYLTRDILYVKGVFSGNIETHVFVNHWSSRREGQQETEHKRIAAAKVLRKKVENIQKTNPAANIIILGDFNDHPTDKSLETILRAKESGYESEGDLINLLYDDHIQGKGTSVHDRKWGVIDQIIVSQALYDGTSGIAIENRNAEILREDELIFTYPDGGQKPSSSYGGKKYYGGFSDHLPVYIILK